jgi:hypothetical protein
MAAIVVNIKRGQVWLHKARGDHYVVMALARNQTADYILDNKVVVVYQKLGLNGVDETYTRLLHEFTDGRFELVTDVN